VSGTLSRGYDLTCEISDSSPPSGSWKNVSGGVRLMIEDRSIIEVPGLHNDSVLYFRVPDIHAAQQELERRGVTFTGAPHIRPRRRVVTGRMVANQAVNFPTPALKASGDTPADQERSRSEFYCGGGPPPRPVTGGGATYLSFSFLRYSGYIVSGPPTTASSGMLYRSVISFMAGCFPGR
jgi:hypothetical protein